MSLTKEDLDENRESILAVVREGFAGVHRRQDTTNGRVQKVEEGLGEVRVDVGRQDERIRNIGKEVFNRRAGDHRVEEAPPAPSERSPITRRDVTIAAVSIGGVVAVLKFLAWIEPALRAVKP
jgi:chemotaxis response regulator CheB